MKTLLSKYDRGEEEEGVEQHGDVVLGLTEGSVSENILYTHQEIR